MYFDRRRTPTTDFSNQAGVSPPSSHVQRRRPPLLPNVFKNLAIVPPKSVCKPTACVRVPRRDAKRCSATLVPTTLSATSRAPSCPRGSYHAPPPSRECGSPLIRRFSRRIPRRRAVVGGTIARVGAFFLRASRRYRFVTCATRALSAQRARASTSGFKFGGFGVRGTPSRL